jgi:WD40 repeat protein
MSRLSAARLWFALVLAAGLVGGLSFHAAAAGTGEKRLPVPAKKDLAKAEELVRDIFKEEIDKAKDPETRTKLATYLLQQGDESSDDAAARYVLYREARQLAILAGNPPLALTTIDKTAKYFDVPALELKAEALGKLVMNVATKEPSKALTEMTLELISEALEADNYDAAIELGKVATAAAKRSQDLKVVGLVKKRNEEILVIKEGFSKLQPFVDRLKKDPTDAEANHKLGEYFGLLKGKWDRALPLLAKSNAEPLAGLAKRDLDGPKDAKEQLALADTYWDLAGKHQEPASLRLQERAAVWYDKAMPNLTGLSRTKAQKRYDQVAARLDGSQTTVIAPGPVGFIRTLDGHSTEIRSLAISHDGKHGLSGSVDNTMRLWDLNTGKELMSFKGHTKQVWGVAFVPHSKYVLSASWDESVRMWDTTTGKDVYTFRHPIDVNGVTVSKDGKWMLTCCDDKYMRLFDLTTKQEVKKYGPHDNFCYTGAFSPNGLYVASGGADKQAFVYDLKTGKVVKEFRDHNNSVQAVAFSSDSKHLLTCGDSAVHMWDIATGKEAKRFDSKTGYINSMALSADGRKLLTGGEDKLVRLWDVQTGKEIQNFPGSTSTIIAVALSADGRRALSGQVDGSIRYWGMPAK